jgi:hypothetical protein
MGIIAQLQGATLNVAGVINCGNQDDIGGHIVFAGTDVNPVICAPLTGDAYLVNARIVGVLPDVKDVGVSVALRAKGAPATSFHIIWPSLPLMAFWASVSDFGFGVFIFTNNLNTVTQSLNLGNIAFMGNVKFFCVADGTSPAFIYYVRGGGIPFMPFSASMGNLGVSVLILANNLKAFAQGFNFSDIFSVSFRSTCWATIAP